jgi:hypothetical protein
MIWSNVERQRDRTIHCTEHEVITDIVTILGGITLSNAFYKNAISLQNLVISFYVWIFIEG